MDHCALISERAEHRAQYTKASNAIRQITRRRTIDAWRPAARRLPFPAAAYHQNDATLRKHYVHKALLAHWVEAMAGPVTRAMRRDAATHISGLADDARTAADNADTHALFKTPRLFRHAYPCQPSAPTTADARPIFTDAARARAYAARFAAL